MYITMLKTCAVLGYDGIYHEGVTYRVNSDIYADSTLSGYARMATEQEIEACEKAAESEATVLKQAFDHIKRQFKTNPASYDDL